MAKILIVEDDRVMAGLIEDLLRQQMHQPEVTNNGTDGAYLVKHYSYDLIILDWDLPGQSGLEICRQYRADGGTAPVLMLTGRAATVDTESGLDSGADDYLVKPIQARVFLARIRALLRRAEKHFVQECIEFRHLKLDSQLRKIWKGGNEVSLLPLEFALLEFMLKHSNIVLSYDQLIDSVWSSDSEATSATVRKCVERLRKKIDLEGKGSVVETVHGIGYVLRT
ncbi:MAG: response regulator transcription factor [Candidatus Obscuribacterales bacterium]|nr:response regulator transcription factor [Candidatus Obscuribacterales bacterium]